MPRSTMSSDEIQIHKPTVILDDTGTKRHDDRYRISLEQYSITTGSLKLCVVYYDISVEFHSLTQFND